MKPSRVSLVAIWRKVREVVAKYSGDSVVPARWAAVSLSRRPQLKLVPAAVWTAEVPVITVGFTASVLHGMKAEFVV